MATKTTNTTNPLINFYDPAIQAKDSQNRTLTQILAWSDDKLEYHHDYIQILFPLPEGSPFNPSAPIIDRTTFSAFRSRQDLRDNLKKSLIRLLSFYGFEFSIDGSVIPGENYHLASKNWVKRFNHNHLRITRIIRSLRVLGLETEAEAFFKALMGVCEQSGKVSDKSIMFWERAAKRLLFLAPEDERDKERGAAFLYEFEYARADGGEGVDAGGEDGKGGA